MSHTFDERFNIDNKTKGNIIYDEHLVRYEFIKRFIKEKKVLDIACGTGYGSKIIAESGAEKVIAVDIDKEAIESAKKKYFHKNIEYLVCSAEEIKLEDKSVDVIISFETIEHLKNQKNYLSELARVIKDEGVVIISTPNREVFKEENPYHLKEYNKDEFVSEIKNSFNNFILLEQSNGIASFIKTSNSDRGELHINDNGSEPLYYIAICSKKDIARDYFSLDNVASINPVALNNLQNNPGLKIVNKIYSIIIKIPGVKKLIGKNSL